VSILARILARTVPGPTVRPALGACLDSTYTPSLLYPHICYKRRSYTISRAVLAAKLGRSIRDGYFALHSCDRPRCVNADHLREGTASDNMIDRADRTGNPMWRPEIAAKTGLGTRGELNGRARLNTEAMKVMAFLFARGVSVTRLSRAYGLSEPTIRRGIRGDGYFGQTRRAA
jgi:hypothetical protein